MLERHGKPILIGLVFGLFLGIVQPGALGIHGQHLPRAIMAGEMALAFGVLGYFLSSYLEARQRLIRKIQRKQEEQE
ncbi:MAG: hypothetical protein AB7S38_06025 [Vulcanimicrobiota bacterium]